jgi:polysaccharide biosynthesis protein PslH
VSKRLLFLLPAVPEPADSGAKLRNSMLMRLAAREHEVHAIAFGEAEQASHLAALAEHSYVVPTPRARTRWERAAAGGTSDLPDMAMRLWSEEFAERVMCMAERCDAVQAEGIEMAPYSRVAPPNKRVYDAHNAEFLLQRQLAETAPSLAASLYSRLQWRRLERFERAVVQNAALTLAVSEHDANQLRALAPGAAVSVVPNGIDVAAYPFRAPAASVPPNLLFMGKLDYRPNGEAMYWLVNKVLPGLFEKLPATRLFVVGANPPTWLVNAGQHDPRIAVTGHVADDKPYLARCAALLLPLQVGGGSRLKALVAMASGLPIVSTAVGMDGLDVVAGTDYLSCHRVSDWITTLARLLGDAELRRSLALPARNVVERCYNWSAIEPRLAIAYQQLEG